MNVLAFTLLSLVLASPSLAAHQEGELSLDDYWRLTEARLQLAAQEWQERVTSAEQAKGDRQLLNRRSAAITKQYAAQQHALHLRFGVTERTYLHYSSDHAREIESFLDENPGESQVLVSLRQTIHTLMERFDALTQPASSGGVSK